ncbi:3-oxoacyl-[acyl-carrier-protein] synthase II [Streptomyces sp. Ncost-T6T-1]|uniref:beta-ketoacyl synthase N-terminal-like domain-containing protein n=1 Tax=Streptomyces sp. Ncost-T6T-1 TaxID=1100828 RepID=UPI000805CB76|nr:beta-ketoacyl synthase N-terminal-like domain-containing protein [Streptomyces sp. Ncost-T6T-1]SBU98601.1 3-oxoacyl-[acyl-carrier-protein] synthase II [Streptomyces sp. Ncost-T6T-1]
MTPRPPALVAESVVHGAAVVVPPDGTDLREGWFDHRTRLGRGHKYLPPACQYLLAASRTALAASAQETERHAPERRGALVGTNSAVAALHADFLDTVRREGADALSPMSVPYFSVNLVTARLSTEHVLKGFNLTVTSPRVAGVEALHLAGRELAAGRSSVVLAGAAEAPDPRPGDAEPEAGATLLVLRPGGGPVPAGGAVLRTVLRFLPPRALAASEGRALAEASVREALEALGAAGPAPCEVELLADPSPVGDTVARVLQAWCAGRAPVTPERSGARAGALAPVVRLAERPLPAGGGGRLVVVASREGNVAFASTHTPELTN